MGFAQETSLLFLQAPNGKSQIVVIYTKHGLFLLMNPWFQDSLEHTWKQFISMPFYCHEILLCASDHRPPSPSACSDVYPWLPVKWVPINERVEIPHPWPLQDLWNSILRKVAVFLFWNAIRNDKSFQTNRCPCQSFGVQAILCLTCSWGRPMYKQMDDLIRSRSSCSPVSGIVPHVLQEEAMHGGPYGPEID